MDFIGTKLSLRENPATVVVIRVSHHGDKGDSLPRFWRLSLCLLLGRSERFGKRLFPRSVSDVQCFSFAEH